MSFRLPDRPSLSGGALRLPKMPGLAGTRTPGARPRAIAGLPKQAVAGPPWQRPPEAWTDSLATWAIFWAHDFAVPARGPEGGAWAYHGRISGSFPVDFAEYDLGISIDVNDEGISRGSASATALYMIGLSPPFTHVVIDKPDALRDPIFYLNEALAGISHSVLGALL